ncbi:MAG: dUTP diphosphatase [Alphaproteobacteria bacterium]|nr:dUTP diphosphatase [Alphaproteobacteria bacterium]
MLKLDILVLPHAIDLPLPEHMTEGSAGVDLYAAIDQPFTINPMDRIIVPNGICISVPLGYNAEIRPRSGLALRYGITVLNAPGTIDSDYRGELKTLVVNLGTECFKIERGMRISQLILQKYEKIEWNVTDFLDKTVRSNSGYGSTGE